MHYFIEHCRSTQIGIKVEIVSVAGKEGRLQSSLQLKVDSALKVLGYDK